MLEGEAFNQLSPVKILTGGFVAAEESSAAAIGGEAVAEHEQEECPAHRIT